MTKPKVTLAECMAKARAAPTTPELELATVEFLDLPDAEQKALLFRELCRTNATVDWLIKELRK